MVSVGIGVTIVFGPTNPEITPVNDIVNPGGSDPLINVTTAMAYISGSNISTCKSLTCVPS